jgi:hypothetical protein
MELWSSFRLVRLTVWVCLTKFFMVLALFKTSPLYGQQTIEASIKQMFLMAYQFRTTPTSYMSQEKTGTECLRLSSCPRCNESWTESKICRIYLINPCGAMERLKCLTPWIDPES